MLSKAKIIILHSFKHGDSGLIIQCYSNVSGKLSLYLRGGAKLNTKTAKLHKLSILDAVIYSSKTSSMPTLKEFTQPHSFGNIRTNIYKSTIATFISEIVLRSVRESETNIQLFEYISTSIEILEHLEQGIANFHLYFMVHLTSLLGFKPLDNYSEQTPIFDALNGRFKEPFLVFNGQKCKIEHKESSAFFNPQQSQLLHSLLTTSVTQLQSIKCNSDIRYSFAKKMIFYTTQHLGINLEIKSLDVLREVFS